MIVGSSPFQNVVSTYSVKLNEEETLEYKKIKLEESPQEENKKEIEESKSKNDIKSDAAKELTPGETKQINDLKARDTEVRAHESAHQAAGGGMVGAASFTYQQGPDGKMYAIGGEVPITIPAGSTPQENIANARQAQAAAMAVSDPSPQDFAVASSARVMEMKAQQQLAREVQEQALGKETYQNESNHSSNNEDDKNLLEPIDLSA